MLKKNFILGSIFSFIAAFGAYAEEIAVEEPTLSFYFSDEQPEKLLGCGGCKVLILACEEEKVLDGSKNLILAYEQECPPEFASGCGCKGKGRRNLLINEQNFDFEQESKLFV